MRIPQPTTGYTPCYWCGSFPPCRGGGGPASVACQGATAYTVFFPCGGAATLPTQCLPCGGGGQGP
jgi:hypothetical protein